MRGLWLGLVLFGCSSVDDAGLHGGAGEMDDSGATLASGGAPGSAGTAGVRTLGRLAGGATSGAAGKGSGGVTGAGGATLAATGGREPGTGGAQVVGSGGMLGSGGASLGSGGAAAGPGGTVGSGGIVGSGGATHCGPGDIACGCNGWSAPCSPQIAHAVAVCSQSGDSCSFMCEPDRLYFSNPPQCTAPSAGCNGDLSKNCSGYCTICPANCAVRVCSPDSRPWNPICVCG